MQIVVKGGTNAGWRRVSGPTQPWFCSKCQKTSRYRRCLGCGAVETKE